MKKGDWKNSFPRFAYSPKMAMPSKGSIATLLVSSICEIMNYLAAITIVKDNSLIGMEADMIIMLRIYENFLEFMRTYYRKKLRYCLSENIVFVLIQQ